MRLRKTSNNLSMKHFAKAEFDCQHTGENQMEQAFLEKIDALREYCGFPFVITSGYRSPSHPLEAVKEIPGTHAQGIAADIKTTNSAHRYTIIKGALEHGFTGIGVAGDFIHVDTRGSIPVIWTY
jgi:zinc D-Ala-D-Ala carboxypeptidase